MQATTAFLARVSTLIGLPVARVLQQLMRRCGPVVVLAGPALLALHPSLAAAQRGQQAQQRTDPWPAIREDQGQILVGYREFATLPDIDSVPARMMLLVDEPGTRRVFVNDMRGRVYAVSYDGRTVNEYLDMTAAPWSVPVQSRGRETGFQSFAMHPQFGEAGAPGFGKFYTWTDVTDTVPPADFTPGGGQNTHDTVLLEWTARTPGAARYDGGPPRELLRFEQPFGNHNGGQIAFNPLAPPGAPDYGLLYIGNADGGSGGDPLNLAQNLGSPFGKILRIDPLGANSANGRYGIPAGNPFVANGQAGALGEIWALGMRNPQRFGWDPANGNMFVADIGQGTVEELSPVSAGANLGWNVWEGSFRYVGRQGVDTTSARSDAAMTYPVAEYDHTDSLLVGGRAAATGVHVYRSDAIPDLRGRILWGDNPSGEVFHVSADDPPQGGSTVLGRVLFDDGGEAKTLLQLIREKNDAQGRQPATRADMRFGSGPEGQIFLLNKADGVIRLLVRRAGG
jgi:hypothetical protein